MEKLCEAMQLCGALGRLAVFAHCKSARLQSQVTQLRFGIQSREKAAVSMAK